MGKAGGEVYAFGEIKFHVGVKTLSFFSKHCFVERKKRWSLGLLYGLKCRTQKSHTCKVFDKLHVFGGVDPLCDSEQGNRWSQCSQRTTVECLVDITIPLLLDV